jgi:hypothetical protein
MSKTFSDKNLLIWEAYPSCGDFSFPDDPQIVFNCLSNRMLRPRVIKHHGDEANAEAFVQQASSQDLLKLFEKSRELE